MSEPPRWVTPGGSGAPPPPPDPGPSWGNGVPGAPGYGPPGQHHAGIKPGIIPLRPLGIGEMLDGAFSCLRRHPAATLGLAAGMSALAELAGVAFLYILLPGGAPRPAPDLSPGQFFSDLGPAAAAGWAAVLVSLAAGLIFTGMLTAIMGRAILGQDVSLGSAWAAIRPRLGTLFAIVLLTIGLLLLVLGVCLLPAGAGLAAAGPGALSLTLAFVGGLLALGICFHLYISLHFATSVAVLERSGAVTSLRRSRTLVRGSWGRVAGIVIVTGILTTVMSGLLSAPLQGLALFLFGDEATLSLPALLLSAVGGVIGSTIAMPIGSGVSVLLYVDRRMRAEGLDLALQRAASAPRFGGSPDYPPGIS